MSHNARPLDKARRGLIKDNAPGRIPAASFGERLPTLPHMSDAPDRTRNRLQTLRLLSIAAMLLSILLVPVLLGIPLPAAQLLVVVGALGLAAVAEFRRSRKCRQIGALEAWAHLSLDLAAWSAFLYFTGGATNPVISILLPLVAIGAAVLPPAHAWVLAATAIVAYSLLWEYNLQLDIHDSALAINWHLTGMWLTFSVSAALITFYILQMTATIRRRDQALAEARERALRDERIVALGSLAAGAAHELGTPLGTLAVLLGEQLRSPEHSPETREDLELMRSQVTQCKRILDGLTRQAGMARANGHATESIADWLAGLCTRWQLLRPGASIRAQSSPELQQLPARFEATIDQALINLMNNAADASPEPVALQARRTAQELTIEISDRGPGFDGTPTHGSTGSAAGGLGIGLVLARSNIERARGRIEFASSPAGGTIARVYLPLTAQPSDD